MPGQINPIIRLNGVSRYFGATRAVDNVSLDVMRGEFFALVGPSGCGKTTLLRILAGFETPDTGDIFIDGRDMKDVAANKRPVNLVFQSYAIFPHMNVAENVGYGLKIAGLGRDEIRHRIQQVLTLVKLSGQENKQPDQLSGGQRQRVALARALIMRPAVLLLDEPMSALDAKLREAMRLELVHLQKNVGITFVLVTHDQSEALSMAGRIAVMNEGAIRQVASPKQLYDAPNCRFVADFIGKINFFDATASAAPTKNRVRINAALLGEMELDGNARGAVTIGVRPERIKISREPIIQNAAIILYGKVADIAYFGGSSSISVDIGAPEPLRADIPNVSGDDATAISPGDMVWCSWRSADTLLLKD